MIPKLPLIPPLNSEAQAAARARQDTLTKPPGSLGRLEALSIQLAAITGQTRPSVARKAVIVMAGDHGVTAEGVSAYPAEVTPQMVLNFMRGGAAINVLARQAGPGWSWWTSASPPTSILSGRVAMRRCTRAKSRAARRTWRMARL